MQVIGTYGVISEKNKKLKSLFLADGNFIENDGYSLKSKERITVGFTYGADEWAYLANKPVELKIPFSSRVEKLKIAIAGTDKEIIGKIKKENKRKVLVFELPQSNGYSKLTLIRN
jgi:hypothetical protein